jgi:GT2 family glycosyltransferase
MHKVFVVIPFYRAQAELNRCLAHLRACAYEPVEIFVRDNSLDNILFTAAVNEGLRRGLQDEDVGSFLVLNQDAYLAPGALGTLVAFLDANPHCGIACPVQRDAAGQVTWGGSLNAFPLGLHLTDPLDEHRAPFETFWANGACMLLRRTLVQEIGLLDSNLRFICSDSDYSFTARSRGWQVFVVPGAQVEHALSSSSVRSNPEIDLVKLRDVRHFHDKWLSGDLYRRLAHEGDHLHRTTLSRIAHDLQSRMRALEQQLAKGEGDK